MTDKKLSEHGFPLIMACDHVLFQELRPVPCDYSPPDYVCENCHNNSSNAKTEKETLEALKFVHLYCSDCIKKRMLDSSYQIDRE